MPRLYILTSLEHLDQLETPDVPPYTGHQTAPTRWRVYICSTAARPVLEQAMVTATTVVSKRRGELAEVIANAKGGKSPGTEKEDDGSGDVGAVPEAAVLGSLDDFDGIVVIGGDGTLFEVALDFDDEQGVAKEFLF